MKLFETKKRLAPATCEDVARDARFENVILELRRWMLYSDPELMAQVVSGRSHGAVVELGRDEVVNHQLVVG